MCEITLSNIQGQTADISDCSGNMGQLSYTHVEEGVYHFYGAATDGTPVDFNDSVPAESGISPAKVFKFIIKKAKEILCPTCS